MHACGAVSACGAASLRPQRACTQRARMVVRAAGDRPGESHHALLPPRAGTPLWDVAASRSSSAPALRASVAPAPALGAAAALGMPSTALVVGGVLASALAAKLTLDKPSRPYEPGSVGREYDAWTEEGILEYYWGAHSNVGRCPVWPPLTLHATPQRRRAHPPGLLHGRGEWRNALYRLPGARVAHMSGTCAQERAAGYKKKDFKQAKYDFVDQMLTFSGVSGSPAKVLDVGCGIGGTTRYLAKKFGPATSITGITLSPNQVRRGTELAAAAGLSNCHFRVCDALAMDFPDNSFDFVWACESGEHMPDKKRYVEQMTRVLKPGGKLVIATWCQRETLPDKPFSPKEVSDLRFLYEEWSHPYFVSIEEYERMLLGTGAFASVSTDDWAQQTLPAWRHSIWAGVWDPWPVVARPRVWLKTVRDIVCLERMHRAFVKGLMRYGMMRATKKAVSTTPV